MTADAASEPVPSLRRFAQRHELTTAALCAQIVAGLARKHERGEAVGLGVVEVRLRIDECPRA